MITLMCILTVLGGPVFAQEPPEELLANPGFNEDADGDGMPDHWSTSADRIRRQEKVFMGGDHEVISQPGAYVLATQDVRLVPGRRYTLRMRCKAEDGGIAGALLLHGEDRPHREMALLWNVRATDEYEEYVTTFEAPNALGRLYLYNIARDVGTVYYDHVSLREGEPDYPVIGPVSLRPIDEPLDEPAPTRHIAWARPLAGGPVKAFITLRQFRTLRQVVELAQRMDLDYDVVHTGYVGDEAVSLSARRAMRRLDGREYEVYVVPSRVNEALTKGVQERVEAGAGLVIIEGFAQGRRFVDPDTLTEADEGHPILRGVPWDLMPEKILSGVQVGQLGQGRVARLVFPLDVGRVWGLIPTENSMEAYAARQFEYWEWWESLFAAAILWAARGEGPATLRAESAAAEGLVLRAEGAPPGASVRVTWRSGREIRFDGPLLRAEPQVVPLEAEGSVRLATPGDMPAGAVIADVCLLNAEGEVLTWGSFPVVVPRAVRIAELSVNRETYGAGETVEVALGLEAERAVAVEVEARLIDAFGRVTGRAERRADLPTGESALRLELSIRDPLTVLHRAFVEVRQEGREADSKWVALLVPEVGPRQVAEDFVAIPWGPGMSHPEIVGAYARMGRELGLNGLFATSPYVAAELGLPVGGYMGLGDIFHSVPYTADGIRSNCLSDPAVIERYTQRAREAAASHLPYGLYGVGITDEAFLTSRHRRHEVCFSAHCQGRYREWLRERYGTLEALNAQWGTDLRAWADVVGARTEDVRGTDNFAPFVEFRTFMTDVWVDACRTASDAYREVAPQTPTGHTNTFGADPFNGNDYWKLVTRTGFGWGQEYSEAIKGSGHKAIFDVWRSFVETPEAQASRTPEGGEAEVFFNHGWIGYDHRPEAAQYEPWWLALHGARGVSYFAMNAMDAVRGRSWALVFPTLSFTEYSLAVRDALADLRAGCGKLLMEYERERPQVALLWSYPSMLVAWCESEWDLPEPNERPGTDSYGTYFLSALHLRQHVNELQLDYDYLDPEQILATDAPEGYPVLLLPFTVAASEALVDRLARYMEEGGVLVGDLRCLRTDERGRVHGDSADLRRLFGVERGEGPVTYAEGAVRFTQAGQGIDMGEATATVYGRESIVAREATALARHETGEPAVLVRAVGRGASVYLNFSLPAHDATVRELLRQVMQRAGVERTVTVESLDGGAPPRAYERNTFRRGPISVHGFIRDFRRCNDTEPVRVNLGTAGHVYDVRAGRYLGETASFTARIEPGMTALYATLPYRVQAVEVSAPARVEAGGVLAVRAALVVEGQEPGDHIFHITLSDPDGDSPHYYARNVLATQGAAVVPVPLALSERAGTWTVSVRDVLSGATGEARVVVEAP